LNGQEVFITDAGSNILDELGALKKALEDEDMTEVQNHTTALEGAQEHIRAKNSLAALRLSYLDGQKSALGTQELNNTNQLSELEKANTAEAIIQLQQNQTALQAPCRSQPCSTT